MAAMSLAARALGLAVLSLLALFVRELRLSAFDLHRQSQRYEDVYYLPPADWLPVISLGFRDALADLIWCKSLVYFGEQLGERGVLKFAFDYTDAVLALDPNFRAAYRWASVVALSRPTVSSVEDGMKGARYLERALELWPNDGQLHWDYGSLLRFQLAPLLSKGPEKERLLWMAAPHLAAAASLGAGPPWLALNSSSLLERLGRNDQAIRHLEEVYGTVQDDATRRKIEERLADLRSQSFVEAIKAATAAFERSRLESYPYMGPGLFMLVGPKLNSSWTDLLKSRFLPAEPELAEPLQE